jgi:hypothetical protein
LMNITKQWLFRIFPNLKHLIVTYQQFSLSDYESVSIFNKIFNKSKVASSPSQLEQLTEMSYVYFPNVPHMEIISLNNKFHIRNFYERDIINIFNRLENLRTLSFYISCNNMRCCSISGAEKKLIPIIEKLNLNGRSMKYRFKCHSNYVHIFKKEL